MVEINQVINAAGKLTALGGSAQSEAVAAEQARWARRHVDLAELRRTAGRRLALWCGADAGCVTSGAAAGVAISVAAIVAGTNRYRIQQLPASDTPHRVALQAGHAVNYGATVEQLIRLGGATPFVIGSVNSVTEGLLADALDTERVSAFLYVKSHHTQQENMVSLESVVRICHARRIPVIVDAAAEEDLERFIDADADLVTYSGGKAFGGPTSGFIVGRKALIEACEAQFQGIARTMKVGKEQITALLVAMEAYTSADPAERARLLGARNERLINRCGEQKLLELSLKPDEAGRPFERVAVRLRRGDIRKLVQFLVDGNPSIRTRNHHLDKGELLIDPREIQDEDVDTIADRLNEFARTHS